MNQKIRNTRQKLQRLLIVFGFMFTTSSLWAQNIANITNLRATATTCTSVDLTWEDVSGEDAYRIRRRIPGQTFTILKDESAGTTKFTDNTAKANTSYEYMVRPMKNGTAAAISNIAPVNTGSCSGSGSTDTGCDIANFPGGRVAITFDGNMHDDDDIIALPFSMAYWWAAGLKDKVIHVEYNNHVCNHGSENDGTGAGSGNDFANMRTSVNGCVTHFGYDAGIFYDFSREGNASTQALAAHIEASTAQNPFWFICGGPMETAWRALEAANSGFEHVIMISHSKWNQNHNDCNNDHTWANIKNKYENKGVTFVESCASPNKDCNNFTNPLILTNQNGQSNLPDQDLSTPKSQWQWMNNHNTPFIKWLWNRNPFNNKFDPSDAGMSYYLITGGPFQNGDERANSAKTKFLFENPCSEVQAVSSITEMDQTVSADANCDGYEEQDGLLVIEMEKTSFNSNWKKRTSINGYTGTGYIQWEGNEYFNNTSNGRIEIPIKINTPGTYEVLLRVAIGDLSHGTTEHNDTWIKIVADNFFARKNDHLVKPKPSCRNTAGYDCPNGSSVDGFFKLFGGNGWQWKNNTSDNDAHAVHATFNKAGNYKIILAARSSYHALDRIVLYNTATSNKTLAQNLNNKETNCTGSTSEPSDISDLLATVKSCRRIKLTWGDVNNEDGYRIRRKPKNGTYMILKDVDANITQHIDNTVEANTQYIYMVRPLKNGKAVAISNTQDPTTPACGSSLKSNPLNTNEQTSLSLKPLNQNTQQTVEVKVAPNPTTGTITVRANTKIQSIKTSTISGMQVMEHTNIFETKKTINLQSLNNGIYILTINTGNGIVTKKVMKQ